MLNKVLSVVKEHPETVKKVAIVLGIVAGAVVVGLILEKYGTFEMVEEVVDPTQLV